LLESVRWVDPEMIGKEPAKFVKKRDSTVLLKADTLILIRSSAHARVGNFPPSWCKERKEGNSSERIFLGSNTPARGGKEPTRSKQGKGRATKQSLYGSTAPRKRGKERKTTPEYVSAPHQSGGC